MTCCLKRVWQVVAPFVTWWSSNCWQSSWGSRMPTRALRRSTKRWRLKSQVVWRFWRCLTLKRFEGHLRAHRWNVACALPSHPPDWRGRILVQAVQAGKELGDQDPGCDHLDVYDTSGPVGASLSSYQFLWPKMLKVGIGSPSGPRLLSTAGTTKVAKGMDQAQNNSSTDAKDETITTKVGLFGALRTVAPCVGPCAKDDGTCTQMYYAQQGVITEEMAFIAACGAKRAAVEAKHGKIQQYTEIMQTKLYSKPWQTIDVLNCIYTQKNQKGSNRTKKWRQALAQREVMCV